MRAEEQAMARLESELMLLAIARLAERGVLEEEIYEKIQERLLQNAPGL